MPRQYFCKTVFNFWPFFKEDQIIKMKINITIFGIEIYGFPIGIPVTFSLDFPYKNMAFWHNIHDCGT